MTCFYTACFQHQLAEQSVTSVTYGRGVGEGCGSAGGGGEEWGRGAVALSGGGVCGTSSRAKN